MGSEGAGSESTDYYDSDSDSKSNFTSDSDTGTRPRQMFETMPSRTDKKKILREMKVRVVVLIESRVGATDQAPERDHVGDAHEGRGERDFQRSDAKQANSMNGDWACSEACAGECGGLRASIHLHPWLAVERKKERRADSADQSLHWLRVRISRIPNPCRARVTCARPVERPVSVS